MKLVKIMLCCIMAVCIAIFLLGVVMLGGLGENMAYTALLFFIGGIVLFAMGLMFRKS